MSEVTKRVWQSVRQPWRLSVPLKRIGLFLLFLGLMAAGYYWGISNFRAGRRFTISVIVIWFVTAYLLLPRIHRILSRIYVPNYFIGRARTTDGLLADPVNLALRGSKQQLLAAMKRAGWKLADPITPRSTVNIILRTLRRQSYPSAPVSDMFVFGRKQSYAFQKEVDGNPAKRHHVRFWHVAREVYLPGGYNVDWVAAATYDDAVGFSLFTFQVTHTIDGDVDVERDFVVKTLDNVGVVQKMKRIEHFFPGYEHRNGGGDKFFTDGSMVIVNLKEPSK